MDFKSIIVNNINYDKPVYIKNKQIAKTNYNNDNLIIKTPIVLTKTNIINGKKKYINIELNKSNRDFFKFITETEENGVQKVYNNCKEWFGKEISLNILDDYHNQLIKLSSNNNPTIKLFINDDTEIVDNEKIIKNILVKLEIQYIGLKFLKQQYTSEWLIKKIELYKEENEDSDIDFDNDFDMFYNKQNEINDEKDNTVELNEELIEKDNEISDEKLEKELKKLLKKHKKKRYRIKLGNGKYKNLKKQV